MTTIFAGDLNKNKRPFDIINMSKGLYLYYSVSGLLVQSPVSFFD